MKALLKSWLFRGKIGNQCCVKVVCVLLLSSFLKLQLNGQIVNYVSNGGFEEIIPGSNPPKAKYWSSIDSANTTYYGKVMTKSIPPFNVPLSSYAYQWPKNGDNYFISSALYDNGSVNVRGYPRNRLRKNLKAGSTYCVKFYCNVTNNSTHGVDALGVYFGDASLDTI